MDIQKGVAVNVMILMVDSADHVTGKTSLSPTVTISKNGGSFASPAGTTTEVANGWYKVALTTTDTNTYGDLVIHATAGGADPTDRLVTVIDRPLPDYPVSVTYVTGTTKPNTITWHTGKIWTYSYTGDNLTSVSEV